MLHMFRGEIYRKLSSVLDRIEFDAAGRYCYEGGGGTTTSQTQQQSSPWAPIQPYLTDVAQQAQNLSQSQAGNNQLPSTFAPFSSQTNTALSNAFQMGQNGVPVVNAAQDNVQNLMQPQTAPGSGTLQGLQNGYANSATPTLNSIAGSNPLANPATALLGNEASSGSINPYLQSMFSAASKPVMDAVNAQFAQAGRTGSGANQQELTRNLGDMAANMYGSNYNQAVQNQQAAANSVQNAYSTGVGQNLSAAGQLSSNAANEAAVQGNAANSLNSQFNTQNNMQLSADQLAPTLGNADWQNIQNQLSVGGAYDQQNQAQLQDLLQQYLYTQQQPWNVLNSYSGAVTGLGGLGGTSSGTTSKTDPAQSLIPQLTALLIGQGHQ